LLLDPDGEAHVRYALPELGWYLVRPDQYIAARGLQSELPLLRNYLQKILKEGIKAVKQVVAC